MSRPCYITLLFHRFGIDVSIVVPYFVTNQQICRSPWENQISRPTHKALGTYLDEKLCGSCFTSRVSSVRNYVQYYFREHLKGLMSSAMKENLSSNLLQGVRSCCLDSFPAHQLPDDRNLFRKRLRDRQHHISLELPQ